MPDNTASVQVNAPMDELLLEDELLALVGAEDA
ncbi:hypothetical protein SAMN05216348_11115 [Olsenella sp. KH3B4]|nr:hypothetical protein SAMN05216348_11115 [Olsenella sp. KH3B4]